MQEKWTTRRNSSSTAAAITRGGTWYNWSVYSSTGTHCAYSDWACHQDRRWRGLHGVWRSRYSIGVKVTGRSYTVICHLPALIFFHPVVFPSEYGFVLGCLDQVLNVSFIVVSCLLMTPSYQDIFLCILFFLLVFNLLGELPPPENVICDFKSRMHHGKVMLENDRTRFHRVIMPTSQDMCIRKFYRCRLPYHLVQQCYRRV